MANYKPDFSYQSSFIPVNFSEQILPGTFEYALCYIIEKNLICQGLMCGITMTKQAQLRIHRQSC